MFRAVCRSSSGAPTVFTASGLLTHVVIARSQVWVGTGFVVTAHSQVWVPTQTWLWAIITWVREPEAVNTVGAPDDERRIATCWTFNVLWNNKFRYQVASCWLLLLSHTTMHGSMNIKKNCSWSIQSNRMWSTDWSPCLQGHIGFWIILYLCKYVLTLRRLMSYIYGAPILDVSRSHTTTQHSR